MSKFIASLFGVFKKKTPDFIPENKLESLLIEAAQNPVRRLEFYKQLLESDVYVLGSIDQDEKEGIFTAEKGRKLHIQQIMVEDKVMIPIFSSLKRLSMFISKQENYFRINFRDLFEMKNDNLDVILNPNALYGKIFTSGEIKSILTGEIFTGKTVDVSAGAEIMLGQPAQYSKELVEKLKHYFSTQENVKAAYLAQMYVPSSNEPPHPIIGIEVDGDYKQVVQGIGLITQGSLSDNNFVDYIQIGSGTISDYLVSETKPFYVRK